MLSLIHTYRYILNFPQSTILIESHNMKLSDKSTQTRKTAVPAAFATLVSMLFLPRSSVCNRVLSFFAKLRGNYRKKCAVNIILPDFARKTNKKVKNDDKKSS